MFTFKLLVVCFILKTETKQRYKFLAANLFCIQLRTLYNISIILLQ